MKKRERGQYVKEPVNEGGGMPGMRIGVVTTAGPRQYSVCWESGHRRRYPQGNGLQLMDWRDWPEAARRMVEDTIFQRCGQRPLGSRLPVSSRRTGNPAV